MNNLITCIKQHFKEMDITNELPFDDVHFVRTVKPWLMDPNTICLIYEQNNVITGYALAYLSTKLWNPTLFCELEYIYIFNHEQNPYGLKYLYDEVKKIAKERGARFLESTVLCHVKDFEGNTTYIDDLSKFYENDDSKLCGKAYVKQIGDY